LNAADDASGVPFMRKAARNGFLNVNCYHRNGPLAKENFLAVPLIKFSASACAMGLARNLANMRGGPILTAPAAHLSSPWSLSRLES